MLGGSSSINGLVHVRGQAEDFDAWASLGNHGWSYADCLPYFKKSESYQHGADAWHGDDGPLVVSDLPDRHPLCDAFIAGWQELGLPRNDDFNGAAQAGAGYFHSTAQHGRRCSSAVAYLRPARARRNLSVVTHALVSRILFSAQRAIGVEFSVGSDVRQARAHREVLLCAGSLGSPTVLQRSGIGPRELLARYHVPVVFESPAVGEGLQDHFYVRTIWRCTQPITTNDDLGSMFGKLRSGLRYLRSRRGPLAISAGYAGAFVHSRSEVTRPDVQYYLINFSTDKMGTGLHPFSAFTVSMSPLRPASRGHVHIRSADANVAPAIQYNFLSDESDRRTLVAGLMRIRPLLASAPMRPFVRDEYSPGRQVQSAAEWLDYARQAGGTVYHPTSTCCMGSGAGAVVDARLRVRGVRQLRVIDASVMPNVVSGNTNAACIMLAEKAADLVLEDAAQEQ